MLFNNPLSSEKAHRLVRLLELSPGDRVLDAGCGRGEFLIRAMEASGASGLGIDKDTECIAAAREKASTRLSPGQWEFRPADMRNVSLDPASFDVGICLGATHAFASGEAAYPTTLDRLRELVRPGGQLLIGEGYWKQDPAAEYLQLLGDPVGIYHDHAGNIALAVQHGLTPLYAAVSSEDEWDDFEWSHAMQIQRLAAESPHDAVIAEKLARSRRWRDGYLRWGRPTMGFGFYLFRSPG